MASVKFDLEADETLLGLVDELREFTTKRLPRAIARDVLPPLQRQLDRAVDERLTRRVPPARNENSPRFVWSTDAQKNARARRWFFANYPNGYRRTGQLAQAWQGDITYDTSENSITASIENPSNAASYVYGSERFNFVQVPGHVTTGWLNSGQVVPDILLDIGVQLDDALNKVIDTEIAKL